MNKIHFAGVVLVLSVLFAPSAAEATPGQFCMKDGDCGFQEVCIREHTWSPSGVCVKGAR
jgi:hypothetical protein